MKRSEMLEILEQFLMDHDFGGEYSKVPYNKAAIDLLSKIESAGMIPPEWIRYTETPPGNTLCSPECTWEPENES